MENSFGEVEKRLQTALKDNGKYHKDNKRRRPNPNEIKVCAFYRRNRKAKMKHESGFNTVRHQNSSVCSWIVSLTFTQHRYAIRVIVRNNVIRKKLTEFG